MKTIYVAGGCFWGIQAYYQKIKGILSTEVGYLNGGFNDVSYKQVCASSGHAEVVKLEYDAHIITALEIFEALIRVIDPFAINRQGNDYGVQYRTGLYTSEPEELKNLKTLLATWEQTHGVSKIEIALVKDYTPAEVEHQDYLMKNPGGYCHINLLDVPSYLRKK